MIPVMLRGPGPGGYHQHTANGQADAEDIQNLRNFKGQIVKLYKASKFCDIKVKSKDGKEIPAHRVILACLNTWFARKLDAEPEATELILQFSDEIVKMVVDCIYTGKLRSTSVITKENAKEVLKAGDVFQLEQLKDEAAMFMVKNLCVNFALDVMLNPAFGGGPADRAFRYIVENFQLFLSDEKLKKRLLTEVDVDKMSDILCQKGLLLWEPTSRQYLLAVEREKQLLFFLLSYVAQDKAARLPSLKTLLQSLRLALLVPKNILSVQFMGAGLKEPAEELGGLLADLLDPFSELSPDQNLVAFATRDKRKGSSHARQLAEACRMRHATIPHITTCSDLSIKVDSNSPDQQRFTFCPARKDYQKVETETSRLAAITVICSVGNSSATAEKSGSKADLENGDAEEETDSKAEEADKTPEEEVAAAAAAVEKDQLRRVVGLRLKWSDQSEELLGEDGKQAAGGGLETETYVLEEDEVIVELTAHYSHTKLETFKGRPKQRSALAEELFSLTSIEDLSFTTSRERQMGPMAPSGQQVPGLAPGLVIKFPKQITRLEKGSPENFYALTGFGLETVQLEGAASKQKLFPIWRFMSANKYYPVGYDSLEFVAGVKKHLQYSLRGIEETLRITTVEDLHNLEKTPVHEVVDLEDSEDDERSLNQTGNDDSVMMIDSDSEDDEDDDDEDDDRDDEDEESNGYEPAMLAPGVHLGAMGDNSEEPIEIPSSSDDEQEVQEPEEEDEVQEEEEDDGDEVQQSKEVTPMEDSTSSITRSEHDEPKRKKLRK